jgi:hypothetical protein
LRRATLLFALILGLTALVATVTPSRDDGNSGGSVALAPAAPVSPSTALARQIPLDTRHRSHGRARIVRARENEHVVVSVLASSGGLATIPDLGRTETVSAAAPGLFDLLAPPPGRYDVMFEPAGSAEPRRVGTLVTRP